MTKARTNASASPAVGRNMVINGAMNVSQRNTSVTGIGATAATYNTCDRWKFIVQNTAGRLTMTQTADGPNGISANCLKLDCTTADTSIAAAEFAGLRQPFEGQNIQRIGKGVAGAKQVTVSFYVKASAAFTFGAELFDADHSRCCTKLFSTTTDWVRHELTFPADVDDGSSPFDDDNAESLRLNINLHAGSNYTSGTINTTAFTNVDNTTRLAGIDSFFSSTDNNFFITGVQMEVGPVATEFEQEDITTTLAKCQRYYYRPTIAGDLTGNTLAQAFSTAGVVGSFVYKETMRAAPTIALFSIGNGTAGQIRKTSDGATTSSASAANIGPNLFGFVTGVSNLTAGDPYDLTFTADAEL